MSRVRLFHPALGREITVPDDPAHIALHEEAGWQRAPEPERRPGYEPEPVTYAPAEPEAVKPRARARKPAD